MNEKSPEAFRTISEVAEWLGVPTHVLRFWESRFAQVKPVKRAGGRRYYRPADMELLGGIRKLLHDEGMTIRGVQKILREKGVRHVCSMSPSLDYPVMLDTHANVTDIDELHAEEEAAKLEAADDAFAADDAALNSGGWSEDEPVATDPPPIPDAMEMHETEAHPAPDMQDSPDDFMAPDMEIQQPSEPIEPPETGFVLGEAPAAPTADADAAPDLLAEETDAEPELAAETVPDTEQASEVEVAAALPAMDEAEQPAEAPELADMATPDLEAESPAPELGLTETDLPGLEEAETEPAAPELAMEASEGLDIATDIEASPQAEFSDVGDPAVEETASPVPDWDMSEEPNEPVSGADIAMLDVSLPDDQQAEAVPDLSDATDILPEVDETSVAAAADMNIEDALPSTPDALDFMAHDAAPDTFESDLAESLADAELPMEPHHPAPVEASDTGAGDLSGLAPIAADDSFASESETAAPVAAEIPEPADMAETAMQEPPDPAPEDLADLAAMDGAAEDLDLATSPLADMPAMDLAPEAPQEAPVADAPAVEAPAMELPTAATDAPPSEMPDMGLSGDLAEMPGMDAPAALDAVPDALTEAPEMALPDGDSPVAEAPVAEAAELPGLDLTAAPEAEEAPALSAPISGLDNAIEEDGAISAQGDLPAPDFSEPADDIAGAPELPEISGEPEEAPALDALVLTPQDAVSDSAPAPVADPAAEMEMTGTPSEASTAQLSMPEIGPDPEDDADLPMGALMAAHLRDLRHGNADIPTAKFGALSDRLVELSLRWKDADDSHHAKL